MTAPHGWPTYVLRMKDPERWEKVYDEVYAAIIDAGAITSPLAEMIIADNWEQIVEVVRRDARNARRRELYQIRKREAQP